MQKQKPSGVVKSDKERMASAKAEFIRSSLLGGQMTNETRNHLGAISQFTPSGGEKVLPINMNTELVAEPFTKKH